MNAPQELFTDADGVLSPHPTGFLDCTNDEYHAGPGISKSHLDVIAGRSPRHYWHKYRNPERQPDEPTPAKLLGSAIHSIILEPDTFSEQYAINPGIDRRSNAGKAEYAQFMAEASASRKTVISDDQAQAAYQVRDSVHAHPLASMLLRGGQAEQSYYSYDEESGLLKKCRFDYLLDSGAMAIDLKSAEDASPAGFAKSVANYRYSLQPPWYLDIMQELYGEAPRAWVFLVVEKEPPYAVGVYYLKDEDFQRGRDAARRDFLRIAECRRSNVWDDYATEALPINLPGWAKV